MKVVACRHGGLWEGPLVGPPQGWQQGRVEVELPEDSTVADLLLMLQVDEQAVCMIVVNGHVATLGDSLAEGSTVDLIPPITGGSPKKL